MSILTRNPAVTGAVAAGLIVTALIIAVSNAGRDAPPKSGAYFVTESGELVDGEDVPAPIAVRGVSAVRAYVFTCGSCDDASSRFVGYVEKHTPQAQAQMSAREPDYDAMRAGHLVSAPDAPWQWHAYDSDAGRAVVAAVRGKCEGITSCRP